MREEYILISRVVSLCSLDSMAVVATADRQAMVVSSSTVGNITVDSSNMVDSSSRDSMATSNRMRCRSWLVKCCPRFLRSWRRLAVL